MQFYIISDIYIGSVLVIKDNGRFFNPSVVSCFLWICKILALKYLQCLDFLPVSISSKGNHTT